MQAWLIFEERDGDLVRGIAEVVYPRGDSETADLAQTVDAYHREGRTIHVLDLNVWLENDPGYAMGAAFSGEWYDLKSLT